MADPSSFIMQAVNIFLSQWYSGLQPSLALNTCYNGEVIFSSKVKSCFQQSIKSSHSRRRRSGQNSRQRRSMERSRQYDSVDLGNSNGEETTKSKTVIERNISTNTEENLPAIAIDLPFLDVSVKSDAIPDIAFNEATHSNAAVQAAPTSFDAVCQYELYQFKPPNDPCTALEFNSDVPHPCSYCEKEFRCRTDFVAHLQQSNYICKGCLDFFTPWCAESELIGIEVDGGANFSNLIVL